MSTVRIGAAALLMGIAPLSAEATINGNFVLDNFTSPEGKSSFGTYWQLSSDRVMGGISEGRAYLTPAEEDANNSKRSIFRWER